LSHDPTIEEVRISPPFDRSFQQLFLSYHWTLLNRVLAPAFSLATSVLAGSEVLRLKREGLLRRAWISGIICVIEAPVLFLVALILAFGHFGPMALDFVYHEVLRSLFLGFSVSTTLLFSFFLREESRCLIQSLPRRSVWNVYRWGLAASLCLFVSYIARPVTMISFRSMWLALVTINFSITIVLQIIVSVYCFSQSWALRRHFKGFLAATSSATRSQAAIRKLTFYIAMSSVCNFLCALSLLLLYLPYTSGGALAHEVGTVYALILAFVYSRIGLSYAQIIAVIPDVPKMHPCGHRNRVQAHQYSDNGQPRARTNHPIGFKRNRNHGTEGSTGARQSAEGRELSAIEESEENESGSNFFSSQHVSGQNFSNNEPSGSFVASEISEAGSSFGVSESTIQYSEAAISEEDVHEFPPFPD